MRKNLSLNLSSPAISYMSGFLTILAFPFYKQYKSEILFLFGVAIMLLALLLKFDNLFLFCVTLYPAVDIIRFENSTFALFGYYVMIVFLQ